METTGGGGGGGGQISELLSGSVATNKKQTKQNQLKLCLSSYKD